MALERQMALERRHSEAHGALVPLAQLADELGLARRTLDRIALERGVPRVKYPLDRRTWVPEQAMRQALSEPQRRPQRRPRPGGQHRDGATGRFSPSDT